MSTLPISFDDIYKLKDLYIQKNSLEEQIHWLEHSSLCENKARIPEIKKIIDRYIEKNGIRVSKPTYRKILVFIVFYIYQPNVLAGKKSTKWLRHHIALALGLSYWRVTGITSDLLNYYVTCFDFRQYINAILEEVWDIFNPQQQPL